MKFIKIKISKISTFLFTILIIVFSLVFLVVSCNYSENKIRKFNIFPTYTGQANQLVSLGIPADYYPTQINENKPYEYILYPDKFMFKQTSDFKKAFSQKVKSVLPGVYGSSWWNQEAHDADEKKIDTSFWQKQQGNILLYENYLLEDDIDIMKKPWVPKHNLETTIQTNFRTSRDPYTRVPKEVFFGWGLDLNFLDIFDSSAINTNSVVKFSSNSVKYSSHFSKPPKIQERSGGKIIEIYYKDEVITIDMKIVKLLRNLKEFYANAFTAKYEGQNLEVLYKVCSFIDYFYWNFLINKDFQESFFPKWIVDSTKENVFAYGDIPNKAIKNLFDASTYTKAEVDKGLLSNDNNIVKPKFHHPIYEQQSGEIGVSPMYEGSMRGDQLYLFHLAWQLSNLINYGTPYGNYHLESLPLKKDVENKTLSYLPRSKEEAKKIKNWVKANISERQRKTIEKASKNANQITKELYERLQAMKSYFKEIDVFGKTFGVLTIAPGSGVSTIQTMSRYSFLYKDLGFKQPIPTNLDSLNHGAIKFLKEWKNEGNSYLTEGKIDEKSPNEIKNAIGKNALFNMDDNGWFWNLEKSSEKEKGISSKKLEYFQNTFDLGVITAHQQNYDVEVKENSGIKTQIAKLFKGYRESDRDQILLDARKDVDYNLWNAGFKTTFSLHMLLDQIIHKAENYVRKNQTRVEKLKKGANYKKAIFWGDFFTDKFLQIGS